MPILSDSTRPQPRLRGARCRCVVCGKNFNSVSAFDRHRYGSYGARGHNRHCRTWQELRAMGWTVNGAGFWIERQRLDTPPRSRDRQGAATMVAGEGA